MIIEDDFCISLAMSSQLKTIGCKIQGAFQTAEEAWKEIKYRPPDLVLLNFYLGGPMNGLEMIFGYLIHTA